MDLRQPVEHVGNSWAQLPKPGFEQPCLASCSCYQYLCGSSAEYFKRARFSVLF